MARKLDFYKIHTPCKRAQFFKPDLSDEYKAILKKYKDGKLGTTAAGDPYIPEHFQTVKMQAEGWVCETDDEGIFETEAATTADGELAKFVLRQLRCFSGAAGFTPATENPEDKKAHAEKQVELVMRFYERSLDRNSPRDIMADLRKELEREYNLMGDYKVSQWAQMKAEIDAGKSK